MNEEECGCCQPQTLDELCPQCRADYEEYVRVIAMLRQAIANAERKGVEPHADAA
jgi:hypothetical protein